MKKKLFFTILNVLLFLSLVLNATPQIEREGLTIYPNPASTNLPVKIDLDFSSITHLKIIDLTGKVVKDFTSELSFNNGIYKAQLDISDLKTGIYFVKIEQQDDVFSKKLIVK